MAVTHTFSVRLAEKYGPIESIILSNICWWVEYNEKNGKHFYEGKYWTYNSNSAFEKLFTYLTPSQIRYTIQRLRDKGALFVGNFNRMAYDRTLWYTVSDEVRALYEGNGAADENMKADGEAGGEGVPPPLPPVLPEGSRTGGEGDREEEAGTDGEDGQAAVPAILECSDVSSDREDMNTGDVQEGEAEPGHDVGGEDREWPKDHSHVSNLADGKGKKAIPICQISHMDSRNLTDGFVKFSTPIPAINNYKKPAAAGEDDKKVKEVKKPAAAAADLFQKKNEQENFRSGLLKLNADLVFDGRFCRRALEWMAEHQLNGGFAAWLIDYCELKKPRSLRGMFYKLFFEPDVADRYQKSGLSPPASAPGGEEGLTLVCPACGKVHRAGLQRCPGCALARERYGDEAEVERQRRVNELPEDLRRSYEKEIREAAFADLHNLGSGKNREQWVAVNKKYHILR